MLWTLTGKKTYKKGKTMPKKVDFFRFQDELNKAGYVTYKSAKTIHYDLYYIDKKPGAMDLSKLKTYLENRFPGKLDFFKGYNEYAPETKKAVIGIKRIKILKG